MRMIVSFSLPMLFSFCLMILFSINPSRAYFDPASLILDQSFDIPPSPSQINLWPEFGRSRTDNRPDTCGWIPDATTDLSLPSTAAFRSNGNCYLNFSSVPFTPDMTVRLNFRLTSVPPHRSVLFTLGNQANSVQGSSVEVSKTFKQLGQTTTVAGGFNVPAYALSSPDQRYIYVADYQDHTITRISASNSNDRTIVAGQKGVSGYTEGPLGTNLLERPICLAFDDRNSDTLYFVESPGAVRILQLSNKVTSLLYSFIGPGVIPMPFTGMVFVQDSLYVASSLLYKIGLNISNYGRVSVVDAPFGTYGLATSRNGLFLFFADRNNHQIKRFEISTKQVTTLAGSSAGYRDGSSGVALFSEPYGVAMDDVGQSLYVADKNNHCIRRISFCSNGKQFVETIAGSGSSGLKDALGTDALFSSPISISYQANSSGMPYLLVADGNKAVRRIAVPAVPSALCSEITTTNTNHVEISVGGSSELMAVTNPSETTLQIRVNNQGISCESLPQGCLMDLPGFVQIETWMDLMITFDSSGVSSLYLNGTLVASNYVMRRQSVPSYQHVLLGTSLKSIEVGRGRIDFVNLDRSIIGSAMFDTAEFDLRRFSIFNTSLSSSDIASLYFDTTLPSSYSYSISSSGYATLDQMEPIQTNFIKPAVPFVLDLSQSQTGLEIDPVTGDYTGVSIGRVADTTMDALGSVGFNAAVITNPGPANHIRLSPKMIGGEFSLQVIFKITALSAATCAQTHVLFSCSALDLTGKASGASIDSILVTVTPKTSTACQLTGSIYSRPTPYSVTLAIQRGIRQWSNITVDTGASPVGSSAQRLSLDVSNLLFTINQAGIAKVYSHGILIATATNMVVPYPRIRHYCAVGGVINQTSSFIVPEAKNNLLAINRVAYWPSTKSPSEIGTMLMINDTIPFNQWSTQSWTFHRKPNTVMNSYARGAALWSGTLPFRPPLLNNSQTIRSGYQINANGYLSFGGASFGGDCTIVMTVDFTSLRANRTLVEFTNGGISKGSDTVIFRTGARNTVSADLVIDVSTGGVWNPNGPAVIYGALRTLVTHTIVAVFEKNMLTVYIDGVPLLVSTTMQTPPMVERFYTLAGRSLLMNPNDRTTNLEMRIFALSVIAKPLTGTEVQTLSPSSVASLSVSFLHPYSSVLTNKDDSPYPILHGCVVSLNPFQQSPDSADGTLVGVVVQQPTPGVYFKPSPAAAYAAAQDGETTAKKYKRSAEALEPENGSIDVLGALEQQLQIYLDRWSNYSEELDEMNSGDIATISAMHDKIEENNQMISDTRAQIAIETGLMKAIRLRQEDYMNSAMTIVNDLVAYPLSDGANEKQYIEIGPTLIGGPFTLRIKFQVRSTVNESMPVLELSNGPSIDPIVLRVRGPPAGRRVQLMIGGCDSSVSTVESDEMNSNRYWLDLIVTVNSQGVVKFYLWGTLVSQGIIQCIPRPVRRSVGVLGYAQTPNATSFYDGAIGLFSISPFIMDRTTMDAIYQNDHPTSKAVFVSTPWVVEVPINERQTLGLPNTVVAHGWLLDTTGPRQIVRSQRHPPFGSIDPPYGYYKVAIAGTDEKCFQDYDNVPMKQCTFARLSLEQDTSAPGRTLINPIFKSGEVNPATIENAHFNRPSSIPNSATQNRFLFNDASYATADGAYIAAIQYFEPIVVVVPRPDLKQESDGCFPSSGDGLVCSAKLEKDKWLDNYVATTKDTLNNANFFEAVERCGETGLNRYCANNLMFDTSYLKDLEAPDLYKYYVAGLFQLPEYNSLAQKKPAKSAFNRTLNCYQTKGACSERRETVKATTKIMPPFGQVPNSECSCSIKYHNLIIIPPVFRFQYGSAQSSIPRPTLKELGEIRSPADYGSANAGNRFHYAYTKSGAKQPSSFTLGIGERIVKVDTVCNYRFTFTTNLGRELVIGRHPIFDKVDICPPAVLHEEFSGFDKPTGNKNQMSLSDVIAKGGKSAIVADSSHTDLSTVYSSENPKLSSDSLKRVGTQINPVRQTWSKPGHSLAYMQGTLDGAYGYRFMWLSSPLSYRMYNFQFEMSAADVIVGGQPSSSIVVDLYNNGPIQQMISSTQSLIKTTESSFSNTATEEHNWQIGGSLNVQLGSINSPVSANVGFNFNVGNSSSTSTTYGSSIISTEESMHTLTAEVPPFSKITATLIAFSSRREIPYTADVEISYESGEKQRLVTRGVFSQVKTDSIIVQYSDAVPLD